MTTTRTTKTTSTLTTAGVEDGEDGAETGPAPQHHAGDVHELPAQAVQQHNAAHVGDDLHQRHQLEVDVHAAAQVARVEAEAVEHHGAHQPGGNNNNHYMVRRFSLFQTLGYG